MDLYQKARAGEIKDFTGIRKRVEWYLAPEADSFSV